MGGRRALAATALAVSLGAGALGGTLACRATSPTGAVRIDWSSDWPEVERVWVGADTWANRLQDWRLENGRVECVETAKRFPLRALVHLTRSAPPGEGRLRVQVRTGPVDPRAGAEAPGFRGLLIGAGGEHVDPRLSAQFHHRPAEDGPLLAVADEGSKACP